MTLKAELPCAKFELKQIVSEWPKPPSQDVSRKHKMGWEGMATVCLPRLEKA